MGNSTKCARCGHVDRSHPDRCKSCSCPEFVAPSTCPLGVALHNGHKGHTCNCVPGQMTIDA